jgi:photosystem II stability/assembly factor-like uncharacterized protein
LRSVYFKDSNLGWVVGIGGVVLKTTDGGTTWQKINVTGADLYSISFADASHGIAAGTGKIYVTTDGGVTWADESPVFSGDLYGTASNGFANSWAVGQNGLIFKRN